MMHTTRVVVKALLVESAPSQIIVKTELLMLPATRRGPSINEMNRLDFAGKV